MSKTLKNLILIFVSLFILGCLFFLGASHGQAAAAASDQDDYDFDWPIPTFNLEEVTPLPSDYSPDIWASPTPSPQIRSQYEEFTESVIPTKISWRRYKRMISYLDGSYTYDTPEGLKLSTDNISFYTDWFDGFLPWEFDEAIQSDSRPSMNRLTVNRDVFIYDFVFISNPNNNVYTVLLEGDEYHFSFQFPQFYVGSTADYVPKLNVAATFVVTYSDNFTATGVQDGIQRFISGKGLYLDFYVPNNGHDSLAVKKVELSLTFTPTYDLDLADYGAIIISSSDDEMPNLNCDICEAPIPDTPKKKEGTIRKWLIGWLIPSQEDLQIFIQSNVADVDSEYGGASAGYNLFKRLVGALMSNTQGTFVLNLPAQSISIGGQDYQWFNGYSFNFRDIERWTHLLTYVRMFNDFIIVFGFLRLVYHYFMVIIGGRLSRGMGGGDEN